MCLTARQVHSTLRLVEVEECVCLVYVCVFVCICKIIKYVYASTYAGTYIICVCMCVCGGGGVCRIAVDYVGGEMTRVSNSCDLSRLSRTNFCRCSTNYGKQEKLCGVIF